MQAFGQRLKELRKERGMTQKEMSEFLGKTERHYQDMEGGKINVPGLTLIKLADHFEVSIDYLVGRGEKRQPCQGKEAIEP
ncbi:XRE family transcriptional regulator [Pseudoflavonifractor sp. 524-17]|nr:XRE family transcriptional regulator [Pseudoflavonifractor sp. 524-17]